MYGLHIGMGRLLVTAFLHGMLPVLAVYQLKSGNITEAQHLMRMLLSLYRANPFQPRMLRKYPLNKGVLS